MKRTIIEKLHIALMVVTLAVGISFWGGLIAQAQIPPIPMPPSIGSPNGGPFLNSPYVLNTQGITKSPNGTWYFGYSIPVNTISSQFVIQVNAVTVGAGQILGGDLVFNIPDAAFGNMGTAIVGLLNTVTGQVVATNAVVIFAQGLQPSPYIFSPSSVIQNADGTWNVGYYVPTNTSAVNFSLKVGSKPVLNNGAIVYGGLVFKVPESYFTSGASLQLILTDESLGQVRATNTIMVPYTGTSPFVLDENSIKQNQDTNWTVAYSAPVNTVGNHFSLTAGSAPLVANGTIIGGLLTFKLPETSLVAGAQVTLKLKDETTGQVRASNTITVPSGLAPQYTFDPNEVTINADNSWRVVYHVPPNTNSTDYVLVIGTKGEVGGGQVVNDLLVFNVPENMFGLAEASTLVLKNITNGKLYQANGTITQGVASGGESIYKNYIGGLLITFPPADQNITQTSAVIKAKLRALIDLSIVDTSYIWSKSDDPSSNIEKPLVKIPGPVGLKHGNETSGTLTFTGLTAGTAYTFVLKNNVTNTVSDPIKFTTPTTATGKSYLGYQDGYVNYTPGGGYDAPAGGGSLEDDISDKGIVPKCGRTQNAEGTIDPKELLPCDYDNFMELISNVLRYALIIIGPIIAILAMYYGFIIMWYGRMIDLLTAEQRATLQAAKAGLVKVAIGIAIILSAWILIATITRELGVKTEFTLLDIFTG